MGGYGTTRVQGTGTLEKFIDWTPIHSGHHCVYPVLCSLDFWQHQYMPSYFVCTQPSLLSSCSSGELMLTEVKQLGKFFTGLLRACSQVVTLSIFTLIRKACASEEIQLEWMVHGPGTCSVPWHCGMLSSSYGTELLGWLNNYIIL